MVLRVRYRDDFALDSDRRSSRRHTRCRHRICPVQRYLRRPRCQDEYILHGPVTLPPHSVQRPCVSPIQSPRHGVSGDTRGFPGGINVTNPLGWRHRRTLSPLQAHDSNQRPLIKPTWCERVVTIQCCKQLYFAHSEADQNAERITQSLEAHGAVTPQTVVQTATETVTSSTLAVRCGAMTTEIKAPAQSDCAFLWRHMLLPPPGSNVAADARSLRV